MRDFSSWQRNVFNLSQGEADFTLTAHYKIFNQLVSGFEKLPKSFFFSPRTGSEMQQSTLVPGSGPAASLLEPGVGVRCR